MNLEMQRGHLSKAEPGLLFRGSVCCSPHNKAAPGHLPAQRTQRGCPSQQELYILTVWEINVNHESNHTQKGTRESHECLAFFFPEITKTCLYKC